MTGGRLLLTSSDIFFVDELHAKLFDIPLHRVQDIYFRKNGRVVEVTERGRTHFVYPGKYSRWKTLGCTAGLIAGVLPGLVIYFVHIRPVINQNKKTTKKLQNTLAKHAITFE